MKNKKTAYFMLPVVLAIWGMIGWKAYVVLGANDKNVATDVPLTEKKIKRETLSDTIHLIANYRDPFLDRMIENPKPRIKQQNSKAEIVKPQIPVQPVAWPKVVYHGLIKKASDKRTVGFLSVDGASHFVQSGEDAGNVKVGRIWKDSVEIFWQKEKKMFRK
jgi:hypothetical protein